MNSFLSYLSELFNKPHMLWSLKDGLCLSLFIFVVMAGCYSGWRAGGMLARRMRRRS